MLQNFNQIAFMPYAPIDDDIHVGNYLIWPFWRKKDQYISTVEIRAHLERILRRYIKIERGAEEQVESIVVISINGEEPGTRTFGNQEIVDIQRIAETLAFVSITDNALTVDSSDYFVLYVQNFYPGVDGVAVWGKYFASLDLVKFVRPYYVDSPRLPFQFRPLLEALGRCLPLTTDQEIQRIFRSLEWSYRANTKSEMVSDFSRVLSMAMAFEILLEYDGKLQFMDKIGQLLPKINPQIETRPIWRTIRRRQTQINEARTLSEWWAYDFYNLRNKIVHGEIVTDQDLICRNNRRHLDISNRFMRKCIKKMLENKGLFNPDEAEQIIEADSTDAWLVQADV